MVYRNRKTVWIVVFFILCVSLFGGNAHALTLYNDDEVLTKLKKNEELSDKDVAEIKSTYPNLELAGSIQLQALSEQGSSVSSRISDLYLRRLSFTVVAHVTDRTNFVFEPEFGKGEPAFKDAFLNFKNWGLEFFAGNHRVPFSSDALKSDISLPFVERGLASEISPDRMIGVSAVKQMAGSKVLVQAGVWNTSINSDAETSLINNRLGDSQIFSTNTATVGNNILIEALRIGYFSKPRETFYGEGRGFEDEANFSREKSWGAAFSFYTSAAVYDSAPSNGLTGLNRANAYEADLFCRVGKFTAEFEYARRNLDWWQYNFAQTTSVKVSSVQTSYTLQANYLLNDSWALALREESFVYDDKDKVLKGAYGQDKDQWLTAGVDYYLLQQKTKVQANYIWKHYSMPAGATAPKNNTALVQATMYF